MPTPIDAPYKLRQREGIPLKRTKWTLKERALLFQAHRETLVLKAHKAFMSGRARITFLPGGVRWWPELAPLRKLERKALRRKLEG